MLVGLGDQNSGDKNKYTKRAACELGFGSDSTILNGFLKTHLLIYFTYLLFQTLQLFVLSYFFFPFPFRFYFWTSVRLKRLLWLQRLTWLYYFGVRLRLTKPRSEAEGRSRSSSTLTLLGFVAGRCATRSIQRSLFRSPGTGDGQILRCLSSYSERMNEVRLVIVNAVFIVHQELTSCEI